MTICQTKRLTLSQFTHQHRPFILALLNEPDFLRFIGDKQVRTLEDAGGYLENGPMASYAQHGFGMYLVTRSENGEAVGMCGLIKREHLDHPDIGYAFLAEHRGKGYCFEAAEAVRDMARHMGIERLLAMTVADNTGSLRIIEKLGLRHQKNMVMPGESQEVMLFSMLLQTETP